MRSIATVLLVLLLPSARPSYAQTVPVPPLQQYEQQKKSPALALTMEALCPIAGVGGFYAGETDKPALLAVLSGVAGGVAVGSIFWLIHLDNQHPSGAEHISATFQESTAISLLVSSAVLYILARASGLALAHEATTTFNLDLQQRLGVTPSATLRSPRRRWPPSAAWPPTTSAEAAGADRRA